jgi:hypothetical protein
MTKALIHGLRDVAVMVYNLTNHYSKGFLC